MARRRTAGSSRPWWACRSAPEAEKSPALEERGFPEKPTWGRASERAPAAGERVVDEQHDHGADGGDEDRVQVETSDAGGAKTGEQEAADEGADHTQDQVHHDPAAGPVHELAG